VGEFVRSGSGDAEDGGNIRYVHHQGQFFQRVILLSGIVIPPPYFSQRAPKGALRPFSVAALLHTFYGALRNILLSAGFPAMFHTITLE
jgi:hypothetical protein